jgi:predicted Zn-dependent protease
MDNLQIGGRRACSIFALILCCLQLLVAQQDRATAYHGSTPKKVKRTGGKDDLDAIGIRNIGGSRLGNWYSLDREMKLGQEYSNEVEGLTKPIRDPFITEYVNRIGQNLVRSSDAKVPFIIKVIDSEDINAFALPGGYLYVNTGLLKATEDEAELAGIMAHEIAHVAARHATRQMTRSQMFDLASFPLIAFGGGIVIAAREAVGSLSTMKFCRNYEAEADYLGVEYLYKAGYDPRALIAFFERVRLDDNQTPGVVSRAFSTHPETGDRIKKIQQEIAHILPPRSAYIVSTSDFDEVRSRLMSGTAKVSDTRPEAGHPVLRRRGPPADDRPQPSDGPVLVRP